MLINKNFPLFYHKDTILLKNHKIADFQPPIPSEVKKPPISLQKLQSPKIKVPESLSANEYFSPMPIIMQPQTKNYTTKCVKSFHFPVETLPKLAKPSHSLKKSVDEKTEDFIKYLSFLKTIKFPAAIPKKKTYAKKSIMFSKENHGEILPESILMKRLSTIKSKNKRASFALFEKIQESPTINSISTINGKNLSSNNNSYHSIKKRGSLSLGSNSRLLRIKNYNDLREVLKKFSNNLQNMSQIVSNENKLCKLLFEMLEFSKAKYLERLFFVPGKLKLLEGISAFELEKACFVKESQFDVTSKSQIYEEKLINKNIVADLQVLNEKIESYLVERHIKEMNDLAKDLKKKIKKVKQETESLHFENMPENSVIDDIIEFRNHFGNLDFVNNKEIIIGKTIDNLIKNMKTNQ